MLQFIGELIIEFLRGLVHVRGVLIVQQCAIIGKGALDQFFSFQSYILLVLDLF